MRKALYTMGMENTRTVFAFYGTLISAFMGGD
jgi:hypothetical protein